MTAPCIQEAWPYSEWAYYFISVHLQAPSAKLPLIVSPRTHYLLHWQRIQSYEASESECAKPSINWFKMVPNGTLVQWTKTWTSPFHCNPAIFRDIVAVNIAHIASKQAACYEARLLGIRNFWEHLFSSEGLPRMKLDRLEAVIDTLTKEERRLPRGMYAIVQPATQSLLLNLKSSQS